MLQFAHALYKDILGTIHHDLGHAVILQQRLQRAQAQNLIPYIGYQCRPFSPGNRKGIFIQHPLAVFIDKILQVVDHALVPIAAG